MKIRKKYILGITVIVINSIAFYGMALNTSWKQIPVGFVIGYSIADVIERMTKKDDSIHKGKREVEYKNGKNIRRSRF